MNEVKRINLNRSQFVIAHDAYKHLQVYLEAVKKHAESEEVVNEIEARMAELLIENRGIANEKVVLKEDIEYLKNQLGQPVDFESDEPVGDRYNSRSKTNESRKLMRDPEGQIIGGVASGLGVYFETDPLWFRLLFIALAFGSGFGVMLYVAMWILLPQAITESDRLKMHGIPVTVDNIKERIESLNINDKTTQASKKFTKAASSIVSLVVNFFAYILLVVSLLSLFGVFTAASYIYFANLKLNGVDIFPLTLIEKFGFGFTILSVLLFFAGIVMVSLRIIRKKRAMSERKANWFGVIMAFSFCLGLSMIGSTAPKLEARYRSTYSVESRTLKPFNSIIVSGKLEVSDNSKINNHVLDTWYRNVKLTTHKNIDISKIKTVVNESGVLSVDTTAVDTSEDSCPEICTIPIPIIEVLN